MDDEINSFPDLGVGVGEGRLRMIAHDQIGETAETSSASCTLSAPKPTQNIYSENGAKNRCRKVNPLPVRE
jgi:hypothetical protein